VKNFEEFQKSRSAPGEKKFLSEKVFKGKMFLFRNIIFEYDVVLISLLILLQSVC